MIVIHRERISEFYAKHNQAKSPLEAWFKEATDSAWVTPQDIKDRYPHASFLANNKVIFNIKGNSYRLVVQARYEHGIVLIEWIGTHAEYDKKSF